MEEIIIRKATSKDLGDVLRLNFYLFKKEHKEFDKSLNMQWTYGKKGKNYFKKRTSGKEGFCVVAEKSGKLVAYLCGGLNNWGYREKAVYAELENMIVYKELRGKGIGTKLTKEFFKWCKEKRVKYINVTASAQNTNGIEFYRSLGFKDYNLTLEIKRKV
jgi:ribosomal protein S18 acetylase RimI-like enzyme